MSDSNCLTSNNELTYLTHTLSWRTCQCISVSRNLFNPNLTTFWNTPKSPNISISHFLKKNRPKRPVELVSVGFESDLSAYQVSLAQRRDPPWPLAPPWTPPPWASWGCSHLGMDQGCCCSCRRESAKVFFVMHVNMWHYSYLYYDCALKIYDMIDMKYGDLPILQSWQNDAKCKHDHVVSSKS